MISRYCETTPPYGAKCPGTAKLLDHIAVLFFALTHAPGDLMTGGDIAAPTDVMAGAEIDAPADVMTGVEMRLCTSM